MLEFLQRLFIGHNHKWVEKQKVFTHANGNMEVPENIIYILECEHCGKLKRFKVH